MGPEFTSSQGLLHLSLFLFHSIILSIDSFNKQVFIDRCYLPLIPQNPGTLRHHPLLRPPVIPPKFASRPAPLYLCKIALCKSPIQFAVILTFFSSIPRSPLALPGQNGPLSTLHPFCCQLLSDCISVCGSRQTSIPSSLSYPSAGKLLATVVLDLWLFPTNYADSAMEIHSRSSSSHMLPLPRRAGLALG